jgi:hypothetical protein
MALGARRGRLLWLAPVVALAVLAGPAPARKPRPTPCPPGRFLIVSGGPLVAGSVVTGLDALVIDGGRIGTDSGCPPTGGRVKATRKGTIVRAKWSECGGLKRVRVKALIAAPACETMRGKVRAKRRAPSQFQAVRSACGDLRHDAAGGEQCDGAGCAAGQTCADLCTCAAPPTSTTLPAGLASVCGDGVVATDEACDLMALPSGCPAGHQCDVTGDACGCVPIPATIGQPVAFDPGPPIDPAALGLPPNGDGTYALVRVPGAELVIDPALNDPITAVGRCTSWIARCLAPPARLLDDCTRSAPACQTDQPWLEATRCCPSACFAAYEAQRRAGASPLLAMRLVYFADASCFPGVRAQLGEP